MHHLLSLVSIPITLSHIHHEGMWPLLTQRLSSSYQVPVCLLGMEWQMQTNALPINNNNNNNNTNKYKHVLYSINHAYIIIKIKIKMRSNIRSDIRSNIRSNKQGMRWCAPPLTDSQLQNIIHELKRCIFSKVLNWSRE